MKKPKTKLSTYLILSAVAGSFVGVLVFFGVGKQLIPALIWAGMTFIVALVGTATLDLLVPEQDKDPNKPMLD